MQVNQVQLDVVVKDDANYSLFMRQATGTFGVSLNATYVKEMERTTKKKPPKTTDVHIMWSNFDEYESSSGIRGKNSMFDDLVPSTAEQGRIFIGKKRIRFSPWFLNFLTKKPTILLRISYSPDNWLLHPNRRSSHPNRRKRIY
jgi:hypothetical protein